ncbi:MAG: hypothetical protein AVDCRST_MAG40-2876, partial [uncultured Gemmatimonadaceae bacterium]
GSYPAQARAPRGRRRAHPKRPGRGDGRGAHHRVRARDRQQAGAVDPQVPVGRGAVRLRPGRA